MPRTITDIIPPSRRRAMDMPLPPREPEPMSDIGSTPTPEPPRDDIPMPPLPPAGRPHRKFPYGTALIAIVVVAACLAALYFFSSARVEVTPQTNVATVSGDFTATPGSGDLPYQVVTLDKVATLSVAAESTANVNTVAQGTITIQNQQPSAQPLVTNTRFQTPDGLVFKIHQAVTVPAGSANAPGTVSVTVYADQPGDKYNIAPATFTLPGLKNSKSFTLVTAKSMDAFVGGFSGVRPSVSDATKQAKLASIQSSLESDLKTGIQSKVPEGYILAPGATFTTYEPQPDTAGKDANTVNLNEKGSMTAVVFPSAALAKAIAYQSVGTYAGQQVTLEDTSKLVLKPTSADVPNATQNFAFSLSGATTIVWQVDTSRVAAAVAGKTRQSAQVVLTGFPEINKAVLVLRPFWLSTFPQDPAKIKVVITGQTPAKPAK